MFLRFSNIGRRIRRNSSSWLQEPRFAFKISEIRFGIFALLRNHHFVALPQKTRSKRFETGHWERKETKISQNFDVFGESFRFCWKVKFVDVLYSRNILSSFKASDANRVRKIASDLHWFRKRPEFRKNFQNLGISHHAQSGKSVRTNWKLGSEWQSHVWINLHDWSRFRQHLI